MVICRTYRIADSVPVWRAEPKGMAHCLLVNPWPTLTWGHKLWAVTKRTRLGIQVAQMSFFHWVAEPYLNYRVRSSSIWERVEQLLLHLKRSLLRWFGHHCLLRETFQACSTRRKPTGRPRICWRDYIQWWDSRDGQQDKWNWIDGWMIWVVY